MEVASDDVRLAHVTVYARGARIRRTTRSFSEVPARLRIVGLPLAVIDDTVRVEVDGPALATAVRTGLDTVNAPAAPEETPEVRGAKRRVALAQAELTRLDAAIARLRAATSIAPDPSEDPPAAWADVLAARRALVATRAERELALHTELAAARREVEEAQRARDAALDRAARLSTSRAAKLHEPRKYVELELVSTGSGAITLHLEYLVAAARWAPSYVARLEGERATIEVRAIVAQASGEDWTGVPLQLSTAEPARFAILPELHAQRIGRRQQEPARAGFRAPPAGAEALFADYDRELVPLRPRPRPRPEPKPVPQPAPPLQQEVWDEETSMPASKAYGTPVPRSAPPPTGAPAPARSMMPLAPPMMNAPPAPQADKGSRARRSQAPRDEAKELARAGGGEGSASLPPLEAPATPLLDYGNLVMASPSSPARGRLVPAPRVVVPGEAAVEQGRARVLGLPLPPGYHADWSHAYDYAFATDGAVDVRADGAWHSIAVTSGATTAKLHHVAVPREQADVFRVATFANPLAGPLLPGPIDVYDRGTFLVTGDVELAPPGASVDVGLGVDPAVKIARNTEFREEAAGMLRGALRLFHSIAIDVDNVSGRAIELEVRERIPVTREGEDDIEVTLGKVEPAWERWTHDPKAPSAPKLRGGHRWRLVVPAGTKRTLRAAYEVKIPSKSELVGGNRRES